ncbi:hypothetical protein SLS60_007149 [Paraconiothyrium brasiliense]|uniref:Heterokaryon incompatibility domain-containing protein n=1 Tax=Paraconiothyrium brasiliense TaxID=300254 RepID=A0ABR3R8J7_9PLEO
MEVYKYRQLEDTDYIRIIVFSRTTADDEVCFTLEHVSLAETGDFDALSYCWGIGTRDQEVVSDGAILKVTANLLSALRHLPRSKEVQRLWADAICINQEDHNEKSRQIPLMGKIYKTARQTIVWLGDGCGESEAAMQHVNNFEMSREKNNLTKKEDWELITPILENEWFRRLWVVQEVVLAKQVVIAIGEDFASLEQFWQLGDTLLILAVDQGWKFSSAVMSGIVNSSAIRILRTHYQKGQDMPILYLMSRTDLFLVTERKDHLYALYGLVENVDFPVNYSHDYDHVEMFIDFTIWTFAKYGNLDILSIARGITSDCRCAGPSWAPCSDTTRPGRLLVDVPHFEASGTGPEVEVRDKKELCVVGAFVDTIDVVNRNYRRSYDVNTLRQSALELASFAGCQDLSGDRYRKLCAASTFELSKTNSTATDDDVNEVDNLFKGEPTVDLEHLKVMTHWQTTRRPCVTTGDRFAWAPGSQQRFDGIQAQRGDRICILQGGRVPYLLRRITDGTYVLVGECWVQGLMHGEALELPDYKTEKIVLV